MGSLMAAATSFSCPGDLPSISWGYEVSQKRGKEFRRVDVEIVRIERVSTLVPDSRLSYSVWTSPEGYVRVEIVNRSREAIRDVIISQRVEGGFEGTVRAKRILSRSPLIVEDFITAPYKIEGNNLYIGIPAMSAGEQLQLEYSINSHVVYRPYLASPVIRREELRERVVGKHSFYFSVGKTGLDVEAVERLMVELSLLPYGENYRVRVKGYADAVGRVDINERIAKERAMGLVNLLTRRNLACLEKQHYADVLTGTPLLVR